MARSNDRSRGDALRDGASVVRAWLVDLCCSTPTLEVYNTVCIVCREDVWNRSVESNDRCRPSGKPSGRDDEYESGSGLGHDGDRSLPRSFYYHSTCGTIHCFSCVLIAQLRGQQGSWDGCNCAVCSDAGRGDMLLFNPRWLSNSLDIARDVRGGACLTGASERRRLDDVLFRWWKCLQGRLDRARGTGGFRCVERRSARIATRSDANRRRASTTRLSAPVQRTSHTVRFEHAIATCDAKRLLMGSGGDDAFDLSMEARRLLSIAWNRELQIVTPPWVDLAAPLRYLCSDTADEARDRVVLLDRDDGSHTMLVG